MKWILRPVFSDLLAFLAGCSAVLAFAPYSLSIMAVLALGLLFFIWNRDPRPVRAFRRGWLFGLGFLGLGVSWIHISIDQFGNVGTPLAIFITLLFIVAMALYFGFAGWLAVRLAGSGEPYALMLAFPAVWVITEWVRGWFLTGFPWLALGYSQIDMPLAGLAPVLGVYGISWAVAFTAGSLVGLTVARGAARYLIGAAALLLWGLCFVLYGITWTQSSGDPLRVSLVQGNVPQEDKWKPEQRVPTLSLYASLSRANWDSRIVVWPETAVPAFLHQVEEGFLSPLADEARRNNSHLLLGVPVKNLSDGRYFNAMLSIGQNSDRYYKRHLVPFGEFLPLKRLLYPLLDFLEIPMSDFSVGENNKPLIKVAGYFAGISICYEDVFGNEVIQALPEAAFLVNASNDAWFGDSLAPHQHLEMARMRSLETGRYMLRSTNTGISALIDPKGQLVGVSPQFARHVLTGKVHPRSGNTPYSATGNWPVALGALVVSVLALIGSRRRARSGAAD